MARVPGGASEPAHRGGDARLWRRRARMRRAGDGVHERTRRAAAATRERERMRRAGVRGNSDSRQQSSCQSFFYLSIRSAGAGDRVTRP